VILAIDPGLRACGVAWFEDKKLIRSELVSAKKVAGDAKAFLAMANAVYSSSPQVVEIAIEYPQQYARAPSPRDAVQKLVGVIGALAVKFPDAETTYYFPREWKGQVPKDVMRRRIMERLSEAEQERIPDLCASKIHNVFDGIGIGLHHIGRLKRERRSNKRSFR